MGAFSTQATVEARISAARLNTYTDFNKDGTPDAATIAAGIAFAWSYIAGRLEPRYGADEIDSWTLPSDVPPLIGWLSDSLCVYNYSISRPELFPENTAAILDIIDARLDRIANGEISVYGATEPVVNVFVTERVKSDFDPERDLDNQSVRVTWLVPDARELPEYPE